MNKNEYKVSVPQMNRAEWRSSEAEFRAQRWEEWVVLGIMENFNWENVN